MGQNSKQKWLLEKYVSYFFIYSFMGWIFEVIITLFQTMEFENRGYLVLPLLPVYGFGALLISLIFKNDDYQWIHVAVVGGIVATALEFVTSYGLEKILNIALWDYGSLKYNFQGRIALLSSIFFMIGAVFIVKVFNPIFERKLRRYKYSNKLEIILGILCVLTVIDFVYSTIQYLN